jgi:hypothetical protein
MHGDEINRLPFFDFPDLLVDVQHRTDDGDVYIYCTTRTTIMGMERQSWDFNSGVVWCGRPWTDWLVTWPDRRIEITGLYKGRSRSLLKSCKVFD